MTSNRPDEAEFLAKGKKISRPNEGDLLPLNCDILPLDYEITEESKIHLAKIESKSAQYYRKLWTHGFTGSAAQSNFGVFIDDKVCGVFGINKEALHTGVHGNGKPLDSVFLMYGMTVPHRFYRLNRLLTMLTQNRKFIEENCTDLEKEKANSLRTVQMTRYPEAKEMRGLMKLIRREPDKKFGYRLTYKSEFKNRTEQHTLSEWLRREKKWQTERAKYQKSQK